MITLLKAYYEGTEYLNDKKIRLEFAYKTPSFQHS